MATVLIADDELDHRELMTLVLHRLGYDVVAAGDSGAALELLAGGGVDAVLADVRMPGVSGIELCRIIRGSPAFATTPVMLISADVHRHQIMTALHAGADDYLPKPFSRVLLGSRLEMLLGLRAGRAARSATAARAALLAARQALVPDIGTERPPYRRSA
ncbi:response regulator [Actinoplanes sp. G11-F43]|uniref:response regulator n=1 Tax=Actinoplanes sp. G11-F43 TaxID=3424130 RepID=UPI003D34B2A6